MYVFGRPVRGRPSISSATFLFLAILLFAGNSKLFGDTVALKMELEIDEMLEQGDTIMETTTVATGKNICD